MNVFFVCFHIFPINCLLLKPICCPFFFVCFRFISKFCSSIVDCFHPPATPIFCLIYFMCFLLVLILLIVFTHQHTIATPVFLSIFLGIFFSRFFRHCWLFVPTSIELLLLGRAPPPLIVVSVSSLSLLSACGIVCNNL